MLLEVVLNASLPSQTFSQLRPRGARLADLAFADRILLEEQVWRELTQLDCEVQRSGRVGDGFIPTKLALSKLGRAPSGNSTPDVLYGAS
jgi:hypothetical protein